MSIQLFSVEHVPTTLPIWQMILDDLGNPPPVRVARVLGIGSRTVARYSQHGHAPRVACLALFWLTRWGRSSVHTQATNDAIVACGYAESLRRDVQRLEGQLAHLLALGGSGASNDPLLRGPGGLGGTPR